MVGLQVLVLAIGVRVPVSEPNSQYNFVVLFRHATHTVVHIRSSL